MFSAFKKLSIIFFIFHSFLAISHSGRTNSSGCHNDRKNGGYHCHGVKKEASHNRKPASLENDGVPSIKILSQNSFKNIKYSFDVEVNLIKGKLPKKNDLKKIAVKLHDSKKNYERVFINFYLPGMRIGNGSYATGHRNPEIQINILEFMLEDYPQYKKLLK